MGWRVQARRRAGAGRGGGAGEDQPKQSMYKNAIRKRVILC